MKVGDLEFNDTQGYWDFSARLILFLAAILVIIGMMVLFLKEIKESYIDLLRVYQYIFIFIYSCSVVCLLLWQCWYKHVNEILLAIIIEVYGCWWFCYFTINL